eukprot:SAG31_NODE_2535_length_5550_cov_3.770134_7_plen_124_part_00
MQAAVDLGACCAEIPMEIPSSARNPNLSLSLDFADYSNSVQVVIKGNLALACNHEPISCRIKLLAWWQSKGERECVTEWEGRYGWNKAKHIIINVLTPYKVLLGWHPIRHALRLLRGRPGNTR